MGGYYSRIIKDPKGGFAYEDRDYTPGSDALAAMQKLVPPGSKVPVSWFWQRCHGAEGEVGMQHTILRVGVSDAQHIHAPDRVYLDCKDPHEDRTFIAADLDRMQQIVPVSPVVGWVSRTWWETPLTLRVGRVAVEGAEEARAAAVGDGLEAASMTDLDTICGLESVKLDKRRRYAPLELVALIRARRIEKEKAK